MTHAQNPHMVGGDPITNDVGVGQGRFAQLCTGYGSAAIRKALQAVACRQDLPDHVRGGARVELRDVAVDVIGLSKRGG
jgi:hypothetical protein